MDHLIPIPVAAEASEGGFTFTDQTRIIIVAEGEPELLALGNLLKEYAEGHAGLRLEVTTGHQGSGHIQLELDENASLGAEGYELIIRTDSIHLNANRPRDYSMDCRPCGRSSLRKTRPAQA